MHTCVSSLTPFSRTFLFFLMSILAIGSYGATLLLFGSRLIDDDQAVMWVATDLFSKGIFPTPRFFGQAYNTHLESLLAVPFHLLRVPLNWSLPLSSATFSLLPFLLFGSLAYKRRYHLYWLILFTYLLVVPVEFIIISSLPRGFIVGPSLAAIAGWLLLLRPTKQPVANFGVGFISILALIATPSAAPLTFLVLGYFLHEKELRQHWRPIAWGMGSGLILKLGSNIFYTLFPQHDLHHLQPLSWSIENTLTALNTPDYFFSWFTLHSAPSSLWLAFAMVLTLLFAWNSGLGLLWLLFCSGLFLSLGFNKVHDGHNGVFQPLARMYMALPYSFIFFGFCLVERRAFYNLLRYRTLLYATLIAFGLPLVLQRAFTLPATTQHHFYSTPQQVRVSTIERLKTECTRLTQVVERTRASLVVFDEFGYSKILNYVCPILSDHRFATLFPKLERRTWRFKEEKYLKRTNFLLYNYISMRDLPSLKKVKSIEKVHEYPLIHNVHTHPSKITPLLKKAGYSIYRRPKPSTSIARTFLLQIRKLLKSEVNSDYS